MLNMIIFRDEKMYHDYIDLNIHSYIHTSISTHEHVHIHRISYYITFDWIYICLCGLGLHRFSAFVLILPINCFLNIHHSCMQCWHRLFFQFIFRSYSCYYCWQHVLISFFWPKPWFFFNYHSFSVLNETEHSAMSKLEYVVLSSTNTIIWI